MMEEMGTLKFLINCYGFLTTYLNITFIEVNINRMEVAEKQVIIKVTVSFISINYTILL